MKMRKQRLYGLALLAISAAVLLLASTGTTPEDRDATAVLLTLPLGIYALTTKQYILNDGEPSEEPQEAGDMCAACRYNTDDFVCHPHCGGCDGRSCYQERSPQHGKKTHH